MTGKKLRTVRIDGRWERAMEIARNRGDRITEIIEQALDAYIARHGK